VEPSAWQRDRQTLREEELLVGRTPGFYWDRLGDMGYTITAINYNQPDYVEYEVVKGDRTYEVQIDRNEDTGRATDIDVAANLWQAPATERALQLHEWGIGTSNVDLPDLIIVRSYEFSDRDRKQRARMVQELEALPEGKNKQFYRQALQQRGYQITETEMIGDTLQLEAVKNGQGMVVGVDFDEETGKSTGLSAAPLPWETVMAGTTRTGKNRDTEEDKQVSSRNRRDHTGRYSTRSGDQERTREEQMSKNGATEDKMDGNRGSDARRFSDRERMQREQGKSSSQSSSAPENRTKDHTDDSERQVKAEQQEGESE
ncbi:MAG: hypothetical protein ACRERD_01170, partial [Candidatus Binatia bacterium]